VIARSEIDVAEALARIDAGDDELQAWTFVDRAAMKAPQIDGPLAGVPFGVKDVIEVAGMPIAFGVRREPRVSELDAWCVAALRAAGAVPIGKTHTTAYAHRDPAPTYNPLDRARTPGGSSAGSAAAVGAGQVPFTIGTQTIGSVLRPAAYCGVVGFKPTHGRVATPGVVAQAPSLDHVGVIAADVAIARRVARCWIPELGEAGIVTPRLALAETVWDERYAPETRAAVRRSVEALQSAGITIEPRAVPPEVAIGLEDAHIVNAYEAYAALAPLLATELPPELRAMIERGATMPRDAYLVALARREAARPRIEAFLAGHDAVIVPCGDAAPSRLSTGDGSPFGPWTFFGTPAIAIPIPGTVPAALSLQLVAPQGSDGRLLAAAAHVEATLSPSR
jgi:Asp-tRNA(Asn)/Glu-tRNA(Gln) amidotransferase A subunit family amidase